MESYKTVLFTNFAILLLASGCVAQGGESSSNSPSAAASPSPQISVTIAPTPSFTQTFPGGLLVEEYAVSSLSPSEHDAILANHRQEREDILSMRMGLDRQGNVFYPFGGDSQILAREIETQVGEQVKQTVEVFRNDQLVYSAAAGDASPIGSLQGLWVYAGHWVLEYAYVTNTQPTPGLIASHPLGTLVQDGVTLNQRLGYQEIFGFQLIQSQPFYFFEKNNRVGISYAGETLPLAYDEVPHYFCCDMGAANPIRARKMVAFNARRGSTWYYVEMGNYE